MNNTIPFLLRSDSYKFTHYLQLPKNHTYGMSYIEPRAKSNDPIVMFGLAYALLQYLDKSITAGDVTLAKKLVTAHGTPFNHEAWDAIVNEYDGHLPLKIRAVPEGTIVPSGNVVVTVESMDERFAWLGAAVEMFLLRAVWYPTSVATNSYNIKQLILKWLERNGTPEEIHFKLHDFGGRGAKVSEAAEIGGAAHLVNFLGSDTFEGIMTLVNMYSADVESCMPGLSIVASEHSVQTIYGKEGQKAYAMRMLDLAKAHGLAAMVIDGYDTMGFVTMLCTDPDLIKKLDELKEVNARIILRPDSGDPVTVPCNVIKMLMDYVGFTMNDKGYRVLPPHIRVIQGDGINKDSIQRILSYLDTLTISADNIAFGMGGALLDGVMRDHLQWAMKSCHAVVNGEDIEIFKDPITDPGKKSKRGRLGLFVDGENNYHTLNINTDGSPSNWSGAPLTDALVTIYECGIVYENLPTLDQIRARANF
jgi:nicotinamide phosphoribosyltransferase